MSYLALPSLRKWPCTAVEEVVVVEAEVAVGVAEVVTVAVAGAATALAPTLMVAVVVVTLAGGKQFDRLFRVAHV